MLQAFVTSMRKNSDVHSPAAARRFAVPAFLIIATVRGLLLNFGVYYATRAALGITEFQWSPAIGCVPLEHRPVATCQKHDMLQT